VGRKGTVVGLGGLPTRPEKGVKRQAEVIGRKRTEGGPLAMKKEKRVLSPFLWLKMGGKHRERICDSGGRGRLTPQTTGGHEGLESWG